MLDGMGEATAAVAPAVAFAFLADPRHADEWFAGAGFETPPAGPARAGLEWSFAQTPGTRRVQPMRMTVYEPGSRFVWETTFRSPLATNFVFEMRCEPVQIEERPAPAEPGAAIDAATAPAAPEPNEEALSRAGRAVLQQGTLLRFTIHLRPGVVQWASVAAGFVLLRRALRERAQQVALRAAEALEASAHSTLSRERQGGPRGDGSKRRGNRKRR